MKKKIELEKERRDLKEKMVELEDKIKKLIRSLHPDVLSTSGTARRVAEGMVASRTMAITAGGAAAGAAGGALLGALAGIPLGPPGIVMGVIGGLGGGSYAIKGLPISAQAVINRIRKKKEALLDAKIEYIEKALSGEEIDFVLNPKFEGEEEIVYGQPSDADLIKKLRINLDRALRTQARAVVEARRAIVVKWPDKFPITFCPPVCTRKWRDEEVWGRTWGELLDSVDVKNRDVRFLNDEALKESEIATLAACMIDRRYGSGIEERAERISFLKGSIRDMWHHTKKSWSQIRKIKLKTINLSNFPLTKEILEELFLARWDQFDTESLILSQNHLKDKEIIYLKKTIVASEKSFSSLSTLDLSGNELTAESFEPIRELVSVLDLEVLDLSDNACCSQNKLVGTGKTVLVSGVVDPLGDFLQLIPTKMPSLKFLSFRNIDLRIPEGGINPIERLCYALKCAPFLERVDLRNNPNLRSAALSLIQQGVRESLAIRELCFDETNETLASEIKEEISKHHQLFKILGTEQPVLVALLERLRNQENLALVMERFLSLFVELGAEKQSLEAFHKRLRKERELILEIEAFLSSSFFKMFGAEEKILKTLEKSLKSQRELISGIEKLLPSVEALSPEQPNLVTLIEHLKNQTELPLKIGKFLLFFAKLDAEQSSCLTLLKRLWEQTKLPLEIERFLSRPKSIPGKLEVVPALYFNYEVIDWILKGILKERKENRREDAVSEREVIGYIRAFEKWSPLCEAEQRQTEISTSRETKNNLRVVVMEQKRAGEEGSTTTGTQNNSHVFMVEQTSSAGKELPTSHVHNSQPAIVERKLIEEETPTSELEQRNSNFYSINKTISYQFDVEKRQVKTSVPQRKKSNAQETKMTEWKRDFS